MQKNLNMCRDALTAAFLVHLTAYAQAAGTTAIVKF